MDAPNVFVTGGLRFGDPDWSLSVGFDDPGDAIHAFINAWPVDGTVYIVGMPFDERINLSEAEYILSQLPGRKVLVYDDTKVDEYLAQVLTFGGWHETTPELEIHTWGLPIWLGCRPRQGVLSFHLDDTVHDSPTTVNIDWSLWSRCDPSNPSEWSGFMTPYFLAMYAMQLGDGFLTPVSK